MNDLAINNSMIYDSDKLLDRKGICPDCSGDNWHYDDSGNEVCNECGCILKKAE